MLGQGSALLCSLTLASLSSLPPPPSGRISQWGLNAYLYAPKDDDKHRAYWRELYTLDEADHLSQLIQDATANGVSFIYAISPGLDITFSSDKEVALLKRKLDQVGRWGLWSVSSKGVYIYILHEGSHVSLLGGGGRGFDCWWHHWWWWWLVEQNLKERNCFAQVPTHSWEGWWAELLLA